MSKPRRARNDDRDVTTRGHGDAGATGKEETATQWERTRLRESAAVSPGSAGLKSGDWFAPNFGHAEVSGDTRM